MEVMPPAAVWEKLSVNIDEINADNSIAKKVLGAALTPPAAAWDNISIAIGTEEKKEPARRGILSMRVIRCDFLPPMQAPHAHALLHATAVGGGGGGGGGGAGSNTTPPKFVRRGSIMQDISPGTSIATINPETNSKSKRNKSENARNNRIYAASQVSNVQYAALNSETPGGNSFGQSIDDLSLVTSDQNYFTMVNANGRLVKIPAEFANLAPHLQNKPVSEDYYEVMFGEGTYWKETLNEWRKKVASLPVSSGDAFTSFIELLKTVQDK